MHGVGPFDGGGPGGQPRVVLHMPVDGARAVGEHVGCNPFSSRPEPRHVRLASRLDTLVTMNTPPHFRAKHRILMLLMKWRVLLLVTAGFIVSRRRQARFYAACLRGEIGGGVDLASCPAALCQLARARMPNSLGRLPEDVLHHIGGLAFGASNPHVDELKKAAKRPMIKRVDEDAVYNYYVHERKPSRGNARFNFLGRKPGRH